MKVLVTGVTGFIGKALFAELLKNGFDLTVVLRKKNIFFIDNVNQIIVSDLLDANVNWRQVLENIDCPPVSGYMSAQ